ncbi:MAG: hypothetical protein ACKO7N_00930 [Candidatus Nitrosotenuis sp.]
MSQETSIISYNSLNLGPRQHKILHCIKDMGCPTNLEISTFLNIPINQVTPRTNELVKLGLVVECEKRICSVSHRLAISWRVKN